MVRGHYSTINKHASWIRTIVLKLYCHTRRTDAKCVDLKRKSSGLRDNKQINKYNFCVYFWSRHGFGVPELLIDSCLFPLKLNSPNLLCVFNYHHFAGLSIIACMRSLLGNQALNILSHRRVCMEYREGMYACGKRSCQCVMLQPPPVSVNGVASHRFMFWDKTYVWLYVCVCVCQCVCPL